MIPIATDIPLPRRATVTLALIAANVLVFLFELSLSVDGLEQLFVQLGIVPLRYADPAWAASQDWLAPAFLPFLTTMFLHGGWAHLLGNLWTLWIFGRGVEGRLGPLRYLGFYFVGGLAAGLLHAQFQATEVMPAIGASGAIAGVMGAALLLFPRGRLLMLVPILFYPLVIEVPSVFYLGFWFLSQLLQGSASLVSSGAAGGVAWWAHVGGFLAGLSLLGCFVRAPRATSGPAAERVAEQQYLRPGHELLRPSDEQGRRRLIVIRRGHE